MNNTRLLNFRTLIDTHLFPLALILLPLTFLIPKVSFSNVALIFLALLWILKANFKERLLKALKNKLTLLFIATYLIFAVCLIYSENLPAGLRMLEKKIPILLFPLILSTEVFEKKMIEKILFAFVIACILASSVCVFSIIYQDVFSAGSQSGFTIDSLERERLSSILKLHPPYFSLYVTFANIIVVFFLASEWSRLSPLIKCGSIAAFVLLVVVNLILSTRMPLLVLAAIILLFIIKLMSKNYIAGGLLLVVIIGIVVFSLKNYALLGDRFKELTETKWEPPVGVYHNSTNVRIGILMCCVEVLKENWLLGQGTGSAQNRLNTCYKSNGYSDVLYKAEYNSHNEYVNFWLHTGIAGLLIFISSLLIPLRQAYNNKNFIYLAFLSLIILACITECLLERQKGIIFYAFFNSIFAFSSKEK